MSGHSKWASIKHKKAAVDAKRGQLFTRIIKEITIAARIGGGDPEGNPRLRMAVAKAKEANMPADNVERAIKKGTGELEGVTYEEYLYEGYGPGGSAIMIDVMTDNKNRTVPEIRKIFSKYGGNMGESGCVAWVFSRKGVFEVDASKYEEDKLLEQVMDLGIADMENNGDSYSLYCPTESFEDVKNALENAKIELLSSEISRIPTTTVNLDESQAGKMLSLIESLEEHQDVQSVSSNFEIDDAIIEKLGK